MPLDAMRADAMPPDAVPQDAVPGAGFPDLDPYSTRVMHAFERVGPAVVHVTVFRADGRPAGVPPHVLWRRATRG